LCAAPCRACVLVSNATVVVANILACTPPLPALSRIFFHCRLQVGIIGAGRIGAAYARMMVEGHKMNLVYYDPYPNTKLEDYIKK
jgi:hypothetical protein